MTVPPLISVIGPVEPALLTAWVHHYRALGVDRFLLAFHFPDHVDEERSGMLQAACYELGIVPAIVSRGPWHEHTNPKLRDELRARAGDGWHLLADSDEFHVYPAPLAEVLREAEQTGTVGGLMLDRVTADGALTGWEPAAGLDKAYPLGGFLTHRLLRGDPRKIVCAHSSVAVSSGQHRAPGHRPVHMPPAVVHHFKWREGVQQDVKRRAANSVTDNWQTMSPARLLEARRLLEHLQSNGGRIAVGSPAIEFRPVSLAAVPTWWAKEATRLVTTWRPAPSTVAARTILRG